MDDTQKSRTSDANTTRKRRSSILKSQRPPRTPFSELEFNVATPTDTVKSRRVSFSRRTGVAEFVTNEATTTWKNFYEEHNKSLESSGNDSEVKAPRQPVGHIGKRIFDEQFEEVEAVDFLRQLNNPNLNSNNSLNNVNLTQQLAALENTENINLPDPHSNFEFSTFTENYSKLFGDDLTAPTLGEMSERIDVNFSDIKKFDQGNDDLDDIQRDLERGQNNIMFNGPFADQQNISEYIEIDLNTTHITMKNEHSDMSITDTIHSQVQDISKSCSIEKRLNQSKDWVTDKENIAINPYVTPRESVNFAINEESDKVLVFDGKRLTLQNEQHDINYRKTLLPSRSTTDTPQRKTIVLNVNDDLPNFIEDMHISKIESFKETASNYIDEHLPVEVDNHKSFKNLVKTVSLQDNKQNANDKSETVVFENDVCNISVTQGLPANIIHHNVETRQTILYEDDVNISVTQAVPNNVLLLNAVPETQRTIVFQEDMANISVTQGLPVSIIGKEMESTDLNDNEALSETHKREKRKTIVFENSNADMSVTHAISTNVLDNGLKCNNNSIVMFDIDTKNISVTQAIPNTIVCNEPIPEKRKTIIFENSTGNISTTQAIPNIIFPENEPYTQRRRTILYENNAGDISVTQAIPSNIILPENETQRMRQRTILYENDAGNISVTQAIPSNIILPQNETQTMRRRTILYENDAGNISATQAIPSNIILPENETQTMRRRTILYENDAGNISVTQAIPSNIILPENETQTMRRRTILYENDAGNISVTQAIPSNIILPENETQTMRRRTILYENDAGNISVTQAIPSNIILPENETQTMRRRTILYENDAGNISVTQAIPNNIILPENETQTMRRKTILYENDAGNISVTQAIPSNIILPENETQTMRRRTILYENDAGNISVTQAIPSNIILPENETQTMRRRTILYENDAGNISVTQAIPSNIILPENETQTMRRRTILYENDAGNISVTQAIPNNIILPENETQTMRRKTILYENDAGNISVTQAIPSNIILPENEYESYGSDNIITQAVPNNNVLIENNTDIQKKNTKSYENIENVTANQVVPNSNISCAQSISRNISLRDQNDPTEKNGHSTTNVCNSSVTNTISNKMILDESLVPTNKICENTLEDVAMTQKLTDKILPNQPINLISNNHTLNKGLLNISLTSKEVIEYGNTAPISSNTYLLSNNEISALLMCQEHKAHNLEAPALNDITLNSCKNKKTTRDTKILSRNSEVMRAGVVPSNVLINESALSEPDLEMEEVDALNMSIIQEPKNALPIVDKKNHTIVLHNDKCASQELEIQKRRSISSQERMRSSTITKPIPTRLSSIQNELMEKSIKECKTNHSSSSANGEVLLYQVLMNNSDIIETKPTDQSYLKCDKTSDEKNIIESNDDIEVKKSQVKEDVEATMDVQILVNDKCASNELDIENINNYRKVSEKSKSVVLSDILNMSDASFEGGIDDKNVMAQVESQQQLFGETVKEDNDNILAESMFYITKDNDEENQSAKDISQNVTPSSPLDKNEENLTNVDNLQKKLVELRSINIINNGDNSPPDNRHYEKIVCLGVDNEIENQVQSPSQILNSMKDRKSYKTADDTDYLLQMLSDLTENKVSDIIEEDENPEPAVVEVNTSLGSNSEVVEKRRISFELKREPKTLSRENILKTMSWAQSGLQNTRFESDNCENIDNTKKDSTVELESHCKKTVRMSNEVVKTLHFEEDDTISEISIQHEKTSPLKKTAFGETSYMKECKANVIPSYLKDVSDGIKALMHDLVKPTADTMPFEAIGPDRGLKKSASTCSTQIQANLITSSQIDFDTELYSNPTSTYDMKTQAAFANEVATTNNRPASRAPKSPVPSFPKTESEKSSEYELTSDNNLNPCARDKRFSKKRTTAGNVLVFDHENPLNNVFFMPTDYADVHRYNPVSSDITLCDSEDKSPAPGIAHERNKDIEVERVSMQYNIENRGMLSHIPRQSGDACADNIIGAQSLSSTTSKPLSIDQSTDVRMVKVKSIEMNTSITMKGNKELLEASSSLTLVDDALTQNVFDVDIDTNTTTSRNSFTAQKVNSPVKIIYQIDEYGIKSEKLDSDVTSNDEETSQHKEQKRNKRNYSSTKHKNSLLPDLDITPKPTTKVQKMSNSPKNIKTILDLRRSSPEKKGTTSKIESVRDEEMPSPDKTNKKTSQRLKDKTGSTINIQRMITESHVETSTDQETLNKQIVDVLTDQSSRVKAVNSDEADSVDAAYSFTSSKNVKDRDDHSTTTSSRPISECSGKSGSCANWETNLVNELSTPRLASECESSANVVAKIDMLPFMGSHECEWEWSCGDTWSFRLLHARLRLTARLAHRHDNAARTCVRADTPVISLNVEIAQHDKNNPVATTCVRFAAETMRHLCSLGCARAGDVPTLVRRCAGAARLAARWGRHMHDARAHLAYTLTDDGRLSLKVANIPLRSVWEVSMRLELAGGAGGAGGAPWPRACDVRVARVVSDWRVSEAQVRAALAAVPHDWGHVPRTVWRIFKYLKNKTRDDDLLAA